MIDPLYSPVLFPRACGRGGGVVSKQWGSFIVVVNYGRRSKGKGSSNALPGTGQDESGLSKLLEGVSPSCSIRRLEWEFTVGRCQRREFKGLEFPFMSP